MDTRTVLDDASLLARGAGFEPPPLIGGRYRIVGMLGGGGMGNVYLAHDTELDEPIAVKVLKRDLSAQPDLVEMLRREVKLARRVTHPNVVRTFDIGVHEGLRFITMELARGATLAQAMPSAGKGMPFGEIQRIAEAICAGLGAAHDAAIVHRDLKPANVLLTDDGRIVLSDFGIAIVAREAGKDVAVAGTPGYIAPELLCGTAPDRAADIWSLGVILFEMITGDKPYARGRELAHVTSAAPDPMSRRPETPLALARVVTRCLARDPGARFSHPREVATAMAAALPSPARLTSFAPGTRTRVVAVCPFENRAGAADAHVAEGFAALLALGLASPTIRVAPREAARAARSLGDDPLAIGRDLGAEAVVDGIVSRSPAGYAIELSVSGTADGLVLFRVRRELAIEDLARVADEASRVVARGLLVEREERSPASPVGDAMAPYLKGLVEYRRRGPDATNRAVAFFADALALAPDDAAILAVYAAALVRKSAHEDDAEAVSKARAVIRRALALGSDRPEPHFAAGAVAMQIGENLEAARELLTALALAPHHADVHDKLGLLTMETVGAEAALPHLYTAVTVDPTIRHVTNWIARAHALMGDVARADAVIGPPPTDPEYAADYWVNRARVVFYAPNDARVAAYVEALEGAPPFAFKSDLLLLASASAPGSAGGRPPAILDEPKNAIGRRSAYVATVCAEILLLRGDRERALACVAAADRARFVDVVWLDRCPLLAPVRDDPRFGEIRARTAGRAAPIADLLRARSG